MKPEISVVIPTYNRAGKIPSCVQSVVAQSFPAWELVIVDDGSTDNTAKTVEKIKAAHPDRSITYVRQNNGGPSAARNTGVENSRADIIAYLDSDDLLFPSALQDIAWVLKDERAQYGLTCHNRTIVMVDSDGNEVSRKFDSTGLNKSVTLEQIYNWDVKTTSSGLFHRKSLFNDGARWRSGFWIEDLELMLQFAVKDPAGFVYIPKALVDYVQTYGADGLCANATYADWAHAFGSIYALHKNDPLMKRPEAYLDRVAKYQALHKEFLAGNIPPQKYKYFPELHSAKEKAVAS
jgi:glycosyltransferase involved in cell wall biosynthesis